jgi:hypothetical protein
LEAVITIDVVTRDGVDATAFFFMLALAVDRMGDPSKWSL